MNLREALISLGYREDLRAWLKPVGYHLFICHEKNNHWENWFVDIKGKLSLYESHYLPDQNPLINLKTLEAYTRINVGDGSSQFQLSAYAYDL